MSIDITQNPLPIVSAKDKIVLPISFRDGVDNGSGKPAENATNSKVFAQNSAPTGDYKAGDLWFDSDDNNTVYRANEALEWVSVKDGSIAGKTTTFRQASIPTSSAAGDLWIDTDDKNKLYRAESVGADQIAVGEWVLVRDTDIAQALADAATAISNAATAQSTADGKVITFYQATAPTAEAIGDLWIDTDDDRLYRWSGTVWVEIQDADIATAISAAGTAQSTADGKIVSFYQDAEPTAGETGDFWTDTNDKNKLYRWSGSAWVLVRDTDIAQALADAATAQTAANTAQTDANTANGLLNDIALDTKITPVEKLTAKPMWDAIAAEKTDIDTQADTYSVSKTAYGTAYDNLNTYLNTTITVFASMTTTTTIVRATWDGYWTAYYNAKIEILNAIAAKAATLSTWSGVSGAGKPADNADVTSANTAAAIAGQGELATKDYVIIPTFESVDGWTKGLGTSGIITPVFGSVKIQTGTNQTTVYMHAEGYKGDAGEELSSSAIDFSQPVIFSLIALIDGGGVVNNAFYIAIGLVGDSACGFKILSGDEYDNGTLYSYYEDNGEHLNEITGVNLIVNPGTDNNPIWNKYEIRTTYSGTTLTMKFYVNDVLKDTRTTTWFKRSASSMYFKIIDANAGNHVMYISRLFFSN